METTTALTEGDGQPEKCNRRFRRETFHQVLACLIANSSVLGPAMGVGYSAVALGPLGSPKSEMSVTDDQLSWFASVTAITTPIGCILSGLAMQRSRRFGIMTTSFVSLVGWLVIYFSPSFGCVLTGRAICGVAVGLASAPSTIYAAEVAGSKLRGIVVTWTSVSIATGVLIVYMLGFFCKENWRLVALLCGMFAACSLVLTFLMMPESPTFLKASGRSKAAEDSLRRLNGVRKDKKTPEHLLEELLKSNANVDDAARPVSRIGSIFRAENLKPFFVMVGYFFFQQFSGTFVIIYYAVDFAREAGIQMDGKLMAIFIGLTRVLGTLCVSWVSMRYGRRIPSVGSGAGMTLFMGILSVYSWASSNGFEIPDRGVIPAISILMYILMSTMGFLVLPFAMIGEVYPARFKDILSGLTTCLAYVFSFIALKVYPEMLKSIDKHGVFIFYTAFSLAGTIFVAALLPETKGKTLREIEESYKNNKKTSTVNGKTKTIDCSDENGDKDLQLKIITSKDQRLNNSMDQV
ncbi:facilitated trehalose transporter Tret1-2 homolog isoform X1 [Neodiprion pinetum]|uniref:facilitated trehalose transporter Tret1-2 homolog isoform X1 n=2 Tax=Neodiprion pinetum TaxID=441929 RepID=UPI001EDF4EE9|nr:facilitated trehalose transporter Tret1-2 homolog isoform X1 [Neodiprion pinetum]